MGLIQWIAAVLSLALLVGCEDDDDILSGQQLTAFLSVERKINFTGFRIAGAALLRPDGSFEIEVWRLGEDTGKWWVEDDQLCSRWNTFREGRILCSSVRKGPDNTYEVLHPGGSFTLVKFKLANGP